MFVKKEQNIYCDLLCHLYVAQKLFTDIYRYLKKSQLVKNQPGMIKTLVMGDLSTTGIK